MRLYITFILIKGTMVTNKAEANRLSVSDQQFLNAFEACDLGNESFHHRDHIRLAWVYLECVGEQEACGRMAESIRRFAAHHGKHDKYHHTITLAWMRLVAAAHRKQAGKGDFTQFVAAYPTLLDRHALLRHYSRALIDSQDARLGWVEPDLAPLPE